MARVVVAPSARDDLRRLIASHSLPADTTARVRRAMAPLARFPLLGGALRGRWEGYRFILGPWRWMLIIYVYDSASDEVGIAAIVDGRAFHGEPDNWAISGG